MSQPTEPLAECDDCSLVNSKNAEPIKKQISPSPRPGTLQSILLSKEEVGSLSPCASSVCSSQSPQSIHAKELPATSISINSTAPVKLKGNFSSNSKSSNNCSYTNLPRNHQQQQQLQHRSNFMYYQQNQKKNVFNQKQQQKLLNHQQKQHQHRMQLSRTELQNKCLKLLEIEMFENRDSYYSHCMEDYRDNVRKLQCNEDQEFSEMTSLLANMSNERIFSASCSLQNAVHCINVQYDDEIAQATACYNEECEALKTTMLAELAARRRKLDIDLSSTGFSNSDSQNNQYNSHNNNNNYEPVTRISRTTARKHLKRSATAPGNQPFHNSNNYVPYNQLILAYNRVSSSGGDSFDNPERIDNQNILPTDEPHISSTITSSTSPSSSAISKDHKELNSSATTKLLPNSDAMSATKAMLLCSSGNSGSQVSAQSGSTNQHNSINAGTNGTSATRGKRFGRPCAVVYLLSDDESSRDILAIQGFKYKI